MLEIEGKVDELVIRGDDESIQSTLDQIAEGMVENNEQICIHAMYLLCTQALFNIACDNGLPIPKFTPDLEFFKVGEF